jgi:hypothetical protein
MIKTPKKMGSKQTAILKFIEKCAYEYLDSIPNQGSVTESRLHAFMSGYCKAMKDSGFDVTDEKTLDNVHVVDEVQ